MDKIVLYNNGIDKEQTEFFNSIGILRQENENSKPYIVSRFEDTEEYSVKYVGEWEEWSIAGSFYNKQQLVEYYTSKINELRHPVKSKLHYFDKTQLFNQLLILQTSLELMRNVNGYKDDSLLSEHVERMSDESEKLVEYLKDIPTDVASRVRTNNLLSEYADLRKCASKDLGFGQYNNLRIQLNKKNNPNSPTFVINRKKHLRAIDIMILGHALNEDNTGFNTFHINTAGKLVYGIYSSECFYALDNDDNTDLDKIVKEFSISDGQSYKNIITKMKRNKEMLYSYYKEGSLNEYY